MASQYPKMFAAIVPVVGWGHPSLMPPIAQHQVPVWAFAGGRDQNIKIEHFYAGLNTLEQLGHNDVRFTVHEDMGHDTWTRVYASHDLYQWLLSHQIK
jgi:predicted peptidase